MVEKQTLTVKINRRQDRLSHCDKQCCSRAAYFYLSIWPEFNSPTHNDSFQLADWQKAPAKGCLHFSKHSSRQNSFELVGRPLCHASRLRARKQISMIATAMALHANDSLSLSLSPRRWLLSIPNGEEPACELSSFRACELASSPERQHHVAPARLDKHSSIAAA